MDYVVGIVICFAIIIYFMAEGSKKETKKERYADAVDQLAHKTAESVSGLARDLAESREQKTLRRAREVLAERNGRIYRCEDYKSKSYLTHLLTVDDYFKRSLDVLGISEKKWQRIALDLFFIGIIKREARYINDYTLKLPKESRLRKITVWPNDCMLKVNSEFIRRACNHFNIPIEEWIEYGDAVLSMHDVYENPDLREYGIFCKIMPTKNNSHLL